MNNKLEVSVKFLGANAGYVTGSCTLLTIRIGNVVRNILVDYGEYQGDDEDLNFERVIPGDSIDCVLLTHSHLDHCGGLPLLFKMRNGEIPFTGRIYASKETCNQAIHIIRDSAKVHELNSSMSVEMIEKFKSKIARKKDKAIREEVKPQEIAALDSEFEFYNETENDILYTVEEAEEAIKHFWPIEFSREREFEEVELFEGIVARFRPIPHINGSCLIEVQAKCDDEQYTIAFSGDIGRNDSILYNKLNLPVNPDVSAVVLESLHGDAENPISMGMAISEFKRILYRAKKKNKAVIIPTFALDRTAGFIKILNKIMDEGLHFDCFIDTPLGVKELQEYINSYQTGTSAWFNYRDGFPFSTIRMTIVENYQDHMTLTKYTGFHVVITASGMGYGGRVIDYFEHYVQDKNAIFIFPGFLIPNSPSRILHETRQGTKCYLGDRPYIKHCETYWLQGFSSHGYIGEKLAVLRAYPNLKRIFLNHGDDVSLDELITSLSDVYDYDQNSIWVPLYDDMIRLY